MPKKGVSLTEKTHRANDEKTWSEGTMERIILGTKTTILFARRKKSSRLTESPTELWLHQRDIRGLTPLDARQLYSLPCAGTIPEEGQRESHP